MVNADGILFIDLEIVKESIVEIGLVFENDELRTDSVGEAKAFISARKERITHLCGHNIVAFDDRYIRQSVLHPFLRDLPRIDTLAVSTLIFSEKTFHSLPKSYKTEDDFRNNPLEDARLTRKLFRACIERFRTLEPQLRHLLYSLTKEQPGYAPFFELPDIEAEALADTLLRTLIREYYGKIIQNIDALDKALHSHRIELAYIVALLTPIIEIKAHPPYVLHSYPEILSLHKALTLTHDDPEALVRFSEETFGFSSFREYPKLNPSLLDKATLSQREIIEAALREESFIAVLPTGGGKTFTFWLPALFRAQRTKALSVVVSPLQALIKDQIESFNAHVANFTAVAVSGYQSAQERQDAIDKVINGEADLLYLAPESLRSDSIFAMLKNRLIDRFIIDEAHCLSTWGHDFRHDYFFIAEFITDLLEAQPWQERIPVSCFTATAKPDVIEDITDYFKEKLGIELQSFLARPERTNLTYGSIETRKEEEKYLKLLQLLREKEGAALVYIPSSTAKCDEVAEKLTADLAPRRVASFHAKLENETKNERLKGYLEGEIDIIVATTAFGMGVDKPDIQTVVHYEMSDSLENYAQEAGRGARDPSLTAYCPILYDEKDADKHFAALNRTKLTAQEVNAVFRVLKHSKSEKVLMTAREIAEAAGWDTEGPDGSWEIKVKTALLELEREGYLRRKRNRVRFFADAVVKDGIAKLHSLHEEGKIDDQRHKILTEVLNSLLGRGKPTMYQVDEGASNLGLKRETVATAVMELKQLGIVRDAKEMRLSIAADAKKRLELIVRIETALLAFFKERPNGTVAMRSLNEALIERQTIDSQENRIDTIKALLRIWRGKSEHFFIRRVDRENDVWRYEVRDSDKLAEGIDMKHRLARTVTEHFLSQLANKRTKEPQPVDFSLLQLHETLGYPFAWIDRVLLDLHRLKVLELGEGRFIYYAPMRIHKTEKFTNKRRYTKEEYAKRLKAYYTRKTEAIHIMNEYARRMRTDPKEAKNFLSDYFTLAYDKFKRRYKLLKANITRPMTRRKFEVIFKNLSPAQLAVIEDSEHDTIAILAGPGSGKTKVLVHKIASLVLKEDVKPEQFLMLTFSHAAASEFKSRLYKLIGPLAYEVEIRTFHGYALRIVGRQVQDRNGDLLQNVVAEAAGQIREKRVAISFKSVLMLDEFQDVNADAFALIEALYEAHDGALRMIAVGDDDQCIMQSVNGADIAFFERFIECFGKGEGGFARYSLLENYRSDPPILAAASGLLAVLPRRIKSDIPRSIRKGGEPVEIVLVEKEASLAAAAAAQLEEGPEKESVAFLAYTNETTAEIYSALYAKGFHPAFITERAGFRLANMAELRRFTLALRAFAGEDPTFDRGDIAKAVAEVRRAFEGSTRLETFRAVIDAFVKEYDEYYFTLWESYLSEISLEEFENFGKLVVSTMHKSKGREFDRVVAVVPNRPHDEEWLRLLYVAFTRAKLRLTIVTDDRKLVRTLQNSKTASNKLFQISRDTTRYPAPGVRTHMMSLRDVALGFSYYDHYLQKERPVAGVPCELERSQTPFYLLFRKKRIERLSKNFSARLEAMLDNGWRLEEIVIDAVVHWYDAQNERDTTHVLAKVLMCREPKRNDTSA